MAGDYTVFAVDMEGTPYGGSGDDGELLNAKVTRLSSELNGPGAAQISLPPTDPDAALLVPGREVQIRRDGTVVFWGPIVRPQYQLDEATWQCAGPLWYFSHRFMGRADRINVLSNGDFETGETSWLFTAGVDHEIDTTVHIEEPTGQSLKLTGPAADHNEYAYQYWTHPSGGYPTGDYLTASVEVLIPADDYEGPAFHNRGLLLIHRRDGEVINVVAGTSQNNTSGNITDDTEKDQWIDPHLEAGLPSVLEDDVVEIRLYPPHGVAYFDLAIFVAMESLSFGYPLPAVDVTDIIAGIVAYAQDPTAGKSDLNITSVTIAGGADPTGATRQIAWQFAEHRNILDAILEPVRQGTCDIDIELTTTTRTLTVYPSAEDVDPRGLGKGAYKADMALELDTTIVDFTAAWDGEAAATTVVVLGPGDGPDRPEGGATDPAALGGLTLEIVESAPDDITIGQLDQRAAERLRTSKQPETLTVTTYPGGAAVAGLDVGDTTDILINRGCVDINGVYRVAHKTLDPHTDQATFTFNPI